MALPAIIVGGQQMQVGVNGPNEATTLFIVAGLATCNFGTFAPVGQFQAQQATFAVHVGPNMTVSVCFNRIHAAGGAARTA